MGQPRIWFITGASSGFGREMVGQLLAKGEKVVATARNPESLSDLDGHENLLITRLDVTDKASIQNAVHQTTEKFGTIDVLVNNAGYGQMGPLEEVSEEDIRIQFETNVFGLIEVTKAVLPLMRQQRSGHILNLSSIAGLVSFPAVGIYNASKYAVEGLSEALAQEVAAFGIKVTLIEPGAFRTRFHNTQSVKVPDNTIPDYKELTLGTVKRMQDFDGDQPGDPVKAVTAMIEVADQPEPPLRLLLGKDAWTNFNRKLIQVQEELDRNQSTTLSVGYPEP